MFRKRLTDSKPTVELRDIVSVAMKIREKEEYTFDRFGDVRPVLYLASALSRVCHFDETTYYTDVLVLDVLSDRLFFEEELTWEVGHA